MYGSGDVAIQILNFCLLPLYVRYLSTSDYGLIALLAGIEAPAKLFFRWGIDGAFMRFWYECDDERARQRLASTVFFFLLAVNGALLALSLAAAPWLSSRLLDAPASTRAVQIVLLNTFAIGFTFIPFHVLRLENRPREFSALTIARSISTLVLRIVFIVGLGYGVMGIVITDLLVTSVLMVVMLRWFVPLIRPVFSRPLLGRALAFGLPRVPHGIALQVMAVGDRFVLQRFASVAEVGVYSMGVSFGLIPKIALGAFEYAWAPFYYATSREPDAQRVFSVVTTYGVAVLAVMTAGLSAIAPDLLYVMTGAEYVAASGVVVWTAVGVFFYGVYLLTSIGLNITSHTNYYPASTAIGAGVNLGLNFLLIPGYGMLGAAWANGAAYAVQCALAFGFSQRFYPIAYERGRIARAVGAALLGYLLGTSLPDMPPLAAIIARGTAVLVVTGGVLWLTRFFSPDELRWLNTLRQRRAAASAVSTPPETTEMAGEIVSIDIRDDAVEPSGRKTPPS
ncbi:MAG: oligosaccharide flippase family protein [Vicinamibacterales bacterium]